MRTSAKGIKLIKAHEGFVAEAYPDAGYGWSRATIGYGHTSAAGAPEVKRGMKISRAEGERILKKDLEAVERFVTVNVKVPLNQDQFDALVSLTFNIGGSNFVNSTLLKKLNAGDYIGAANEFPKWRKSNGQVFAGLVKRRADEKALFLSSGSSSPRSTPVDAELDTGKPLPQSTTAWSAILQTLLGNIAALLALDWKTALVFIIPITAFGIYILRERKRHGREGLV